MKHLKLLFTALLLLCGSVTSAHDFEVDGIYYIITDATNNTVDVTYKGSSFMEYNNEYSGNVVIPENVTYNGVVYNVISIGSYAFKNCTELKTVEFPNIITDIHYSAFYGCIGLTNIEIPNSVIEIHDNAFYGCVGLTSIEIPNSVTHIGHSAFAYCTALASIDFTDKNVYICTNAFERTAWYENQPEGMVYAGKVFYKYKGTMPENSVIVIKEGTLSIAELAFSGCEGMTTVIIPASLIDIGSNKITSYVFEGCTSLSEIIVKNGNTKYDSRENCNAVIETATNMLVAGCKSTIIPNSVTRIYSYAFYNCTGLTSITIPSSVQNIASTAFKDCSNLESIVVEDGNTKYDCRQNCNAVIESATNKLVFGCKNTIIPNSVTEIGNYAFYGCSGLTSIIFPEKVTTIGKEAFSYCTGLTSVIIPNSVTSLGFAAFSNCEELTDIILSENLKTIGAYAFNSCQKLENVTIPSVIVIEGCAFRYCRSLTSITLPENLKVIEYDAFQECSNLKCIIIPNGVMSIDSGTFSYNSKLESVILSNNVTDIGNNAFLYCTGLKSITIPEKVTTIGNNAFGRCFRLAEIYMECETPPVINQNTFDGVNATLYVPYGTKEAYQSADYWSAFTNILEMDPTQITINVDHSGYGTFCSSYALDFSELEELKAYSAIGFNTDTEVVTLARIMTAAAETGIFVKGEPGTYIVPVVEECNEHTLNLLVGTLDETVVNSTSDSYSNYEFVVSAADGAPMFRKFADNSTLAAGKAYLQIPTSWLPVTAQNCIGVRFEDSETTYVDDIVEFESADTGTIYDLTGRAVENPENGVYIVNGKKVFIK